MIIILCPTTLEYQILKNDASLMKRVRDKEIDIVCSGLGKLKTFHSCVQYGSAKSFLLTGFCGGIRGCDFADLVEPQLYIEQDFDCQPIESKHQILHSQNFIATSHKAILLTQDHFVRDIPKDLSDDFLCVVCDMEGYALAYFAQQYQKEFAVIKLVSDIVGRNSTQDFIQACQTLQQPLIDSVHRAIEQMKG